jgi:hypothetical protein
LPSYVKKGNPEERKSRRKAEGHTTTDWKRMIIYLYANDLTFDNKVVLMASNTHGVEPTFDVQRYNRKAKKYINVQCPGLIKSYNECMGDVDKCGMLLALYRNRMKT